MIVSVRDEQIIGEEFYSCSQYGKFGGNKTERLNKNFGRDVKAGSDLVLEFLLSISVGHSSVSLSPLAFLLARDALQEVFSSRNHKPRVLEEQQHPTTSSIGCRGEVLGTCCPAREYLYCLLEFVW